MIAVSFDLRIGGAPFGNGKFRSMGDMAVAVRTMGFGGHVYGLDAGLVAAQTVGLNHLTGFFARMDEVRNGFGHGDEYVPGPFFCFERDFGHKVVGRVAFVAGEFCVNRLLVGQGRLGHGMAAPAESRLVSGVHGHGRADDAGRAGHERQSQQPPGPATLFLQFHFFFHLRGYWHASLR